jgi:tRNA (cytidine/uridine-2'-O-)-methyltransferase
MTNTPIILPPNNPLAVVLIEPQIPQNTGNIARLCVCTGVELYLIGTLGFVLGEKLMARAGMDYLDHSRIQHLSTFEALLAKKPGWTSFYLSTKATQSYTQVNYPPNSLLVFGSETHGLPEAFMAHHQNQCFRIPMVNEARSLNLSNAVSVVLYHALGQQSF